MFTNTRRYTLTTCWACFYLQCWHVRGSL